MFVAAGAGRAVGSDARFMDFSEGALNGGPELLELAEKVLAEGRIGGFWMRHGMYILLHTSNSKRKIEKLS
jgi:hypothetical protein